MPNIVFEHLKEHVNLISLRENNHDHLSSASTKREREIGTGMQRMSRATAS